MKILVLGKNGMAGQTIYKYLKQQEYDVYGTTRETFIAIEEDLDDKYNLKYYDVVINCIGILNHEKDTEKLIKINALFPHYLENLSTEYDFQLIHISTDCYMDNTSYGHSKWLGELHKSLTIRTSIIGHDNNKRGTGLLNWLLNQRDINGYTNHLWCGITTLELAKVIEKCLGSKLVDIVEVTNGKAISKHDLCELINEEYKLKINITPTETEQTIDKRLELKHNFDIPSYKTMIQEMKEFNKE